MLSLLFMLVEWTVKLMVVLAVVAMRLIAAAYRGSERVIHQHRLSKDPAADRSVSKALAAGVVTAGLGVVILLGSAFGGGDTATRPSDRAATGGSSTNAATAASLTESGAATPDRAAAKRRAARRHAKLRRERARKRVAASKRRAAARRRATLLAAATATPTPTPAPNCDPSYRGACLDPDAYDYDCAGGSGDGPRYTGEVRVVGQDHFGLDRDGDGIACESG